jgi:hypothetical protein
MAKGGAGIRTRAFVCQALVSPIIFPSFLFSHFIEPIYCQAERFSPGRHYFSPKYGTICS